MFDLNQSMFRAAMIPPDAKAIFVSDKFVDEYVGGAELTSQALIDSAPFPVHRLRSKDVSMNVLRENADKVWIFGNWSEMDAQLIPSIVANIKYVVLEYDFKFCRFRSPEKHLRETGSPCNCEHEMPGKMTSAFYHGSKALFWMSERQRWEFVKRFPFLRETNEFVLSSVFAKETLAKLRALREQTLDKRGWIVLGSNSWIKGAQDAKRWCEENSLEHRVIWGLSYDETLASLATAAGFCYLPRGGDTCPRMVIEAKLLGCQLEMNDFVLHKDEDWFNTDDLNEIEQYLYTGSDRFWTVVKKVVEYRPTISGYSTTYNAESQGYPYLRSIKSLLAFCDEVCVVDGGSTDGTWTSLQDLAREDPRLVLKQVVRDWNSPRFAVFDGLQKAEARAMCTKQFLWQQDVDEVVHEDDHKKIIHVAHQMPQEAKVLCFPVVEYWGGPVKVRLDVTPWKWRMSRNDPKITHGIPRDLRREDELGVYAAEGTDGCDLIDSETGERIESVSFYTQEIENVRQMALLGSAEALYQYQEWFNRVVESLPSVFHYSWYDIERKIRLYRGYWTRHWRSLYGMDLEDTADNNMMFDSPWSEVTDEMIRAKASELAEQTGGWIWHRKWSGQKTPHIIVRRSQPGIMK